MSNHNQNKSGKIWKKEDKRFLKKNWGTVTCREIAEKLNRTEYSVYRKASDLGLRVKDKQGASCREAEEISGYSKSKLLKEMKALGITEKEWERLSPQKIEKIVNHIMQYETLSSVCTRTNLTKYELKKIIEYYNVKNYSDSRIMKMKSTEIDQAIEKYRKRKKNIS